MNELQKVRKAAAKVAASRERLELAVHEAHAAGKPLRMIATAAQVSHEQVRRILSR